MSPRYTFMLLASTAVRSLKMFAFLLSLLTVIGLGTGATQPGFEARITPSGLNFLSEIGIRELKDEISKATIPDQSGSSDVVIGTIDYTFSNMHVTSFDIPSASISTKTNVGVTVSASGLYLAMSGDWKYELDSIIPVSDDGTFDVSLSDVSLAVTIEIGVDSKTGLPTVYSSSSDCSFYVGSVSVDIHGGASWLYNLFDDMIEDDIQDALNDQVCQIVVKEVNTDLAAEVAGITMVTSISDTAEIDYSLVSAPMFNSSLTTFHKGEVYQIGNHTEAPFKIPTIPSDPDVSRMVFMWMTDYVANSAGYVLHNTGFFQYNVTQDEIPAGSKISLNTSDFAIEFLIPQIAKLYPNMMMQMNLNTTAPPVVSITPDSVGATINGDIAAYVILPNKTLAYVFTLGATLKVSADLGFTQSSLTWNSSYVSADLKLLYTAIDDFKIDRLRSTLQFACKAYIIPALNKYGAQGVPVPSFDDYVFMNPVVTQGQGFLKIGTDLAYQATRST
ncbi:Bactericidal permeability-increasing protein [Holothuria leucospilota]|uniref:Bactericidal permeability-increasing protein n=1 Tax=Holothuria leucospilota TaxID=206669 RepID=A0A9Q1CB29_HOLLE|nr:Bactericidal permeability-increasing protein [Holothuria leucospilota]